MAVFGHEGYLPRIGRPEQTGPVPDSNEDSKHQEVSPRTQDQMARLIQEINSAAVRSINLGLQPEIVASVLDSEAAHIRKVVGKDKKG